MGEIGFYQRVHKSFSQSAQFSALLAKAGREPITITGLNDFGKSLFLASLAQAGERAIIFIASTDQEANHFRQLLGDIWQINTPIYPHLRADTYSRDQFIASFTSRIQIWDQLQAAQPGSITVFTGSHLIEPLTQPGHTFDLQSGQTYSPTELALELAGQGFDKQTKAFQPGEFAQRGEVFDIFPIAAEHPYRISFHGNQIESIYRFDPVNNNRLESVSQLRFASLKANSFAPTLADFLADNKHQYHICLDHSSELLQSLYEMFVASENPNLVHLDKTLERLPILHLETLAEPSPKLITFDLIDPPIYAGQINRLSSDISQYLDTGVTVGLATNKQASLTQILSEADLHPNGITLELLPYTARASAISPSLKFALISDDQIFTMVRDATPSTSHKHQRVFMADIVRGDYIVHADHGIGRLIDIQKLTVGDIEREYLILEYAKGDKLYVPIDQIDKISKYVSVDGREPQLSRLTSQSWKKAVSKIKKESHKFARELLDLYAQRQIKQGISHAADDIWQKALSDSFAHQETPDQETVINQIIADMQKDKPMDRLLVADVGFGKTEVAIRAAFQAVSAGYQVAVLAPTTILVEQHLKTFGERLQSFNTTVAGLSRFKSKADQTQIVAEIKLGQVDIVVGTHRLLSSDIKFKNLGLIIIDEEQRFGVAHKEKLKQLRAEVDVLSLTATPIPRTLNLALSGIRDISVIETPPTNRVPIMTTVAPVNNQIVKDAIEQEIRRGGQVYFIHNRVRTIDSIQHKLETLMPEIKFINAHGQMSERLLAKIMQDFNQHRYDVLIASTIIENGIDNPNVNTLIVDDAGHFGLSQLHQLRGRVGRGKVQGYAYFLYNKGKMGPKALERLKTIQDHTDLGSGYNIAMRDMQIRGAGGVLSKQQHGHITAIGLSLYTKLLNKAIEELRTGQKLDVTDITIDLPVSAYLPVKYVDTESQRLKVYQNLGVVESIDDLNAEFADIVQQFGALPTEVINLRQLLELKIHALKTQQILSIIGKNLNPPNLDPDHLITITFAKSVSPTMIEPLLKRKLPLQIGEKDIRIHHRDLGSDWLTSLKELLVLLQT